MRVLMLSWEYPPHVVGGLGRHVLELAPALADEGVSVSIVTPQLRAGPSHELTARGVSIVRVAMPQSDGASFVGYARIANAALEQAAHDLQRTNGAFTLIHAHDWLVASAGVSLKHAWRRPLVTTMHATERGRQQGHIASSDSEQIHGTEWWLTYEAWRVITCSHFMARQVADYFSTPSDKIDVVPNGVVVRSDPFASAAERVAFRRRFAAEDQPLVFYIGRLVYEKGLHVLLRAWPQVLTGVPHARLVIAGTGVELERLQLQAAEHGLARSVLFTGFIADEDRDRLYHTADVACFPSLYEPFGMVALEAMAAGCPVVVSATGGLHEVVTNHETGITAAPNNPAALAWGLLHTLQYPEWARARAANALRAVQAHYTWRRIAAETADVYRRIHAAWRVNAWGSGD
jgi:glycosyltransferase involved in cell wall biosynthesis